MKSALRFLALLGAFATIGCEGTVSMTDGDGRVIEVIDSSVGVGDGTGPATVEMIADGAALYGRYCQACHGAEGTGAPTWTAPIAGYAPIHDIVANGRGAMSAQPLSDGEIGLVQAYLLSLGALDWSGLAGEEVFATACAPCHGAGADGTERGPQLRFRDAEYFDYVTRHGGKSAARWDAPMTAYPDNRITDEQLAQMVAWIDSFPNASDGDGLYHQFCANCHGGTGVRGRFEAEFEGGIAAVSRYGKEDSPANRSYMPGWTRSEITDAELQQIQAYVRAHFPSDD